MDFPINHIRAVFKNSFFFQNVLRRANIQEFFNAIKNNFNGCMKNQHRYENCPQMI